MALIIFGIIFIIGGAISLIYGSSLNNSYEARWNSFWESGRSNPGETFVTIGIIALVIGFILLIAGIIVKIVKSNKSNSCVTSSPNKQDRAEYLNYLKMQGLITYSDITSTPGVWQCSRCGKVNNNSVGTCSCGMSKDVAQDRKQPTQQTESQEEHQSNPNPQDEAQYGNSSEIKYCIQCGTKLSINAIFCSKCGTKQ